MVQQSRWCLRSTVGVAPVSADLPSFTVAAIGGPWQAQTVTAVAQVSRFAASRWAATMDEHRREAGQKTAAADRWGQAVVGPRSVEVVGSAGITTIIGVVATVGLLPVGVWSGIWAAGLAER